MALLQSGFHAGAMEHVCYPILERVEEEFFDECLYLPPVEKPRPTEVRVTRGTGRGTLVLAEIRNAWTVVGFSGFGGVQLKTSGATNVSYAFCLEAEDIEDGANVVVQIDGLPISLLIRRNRRAGEVDEKLQPGEDDRAFRD